MGAEFLGTLALVAFGTGAIAVGVDHPGTIGPAGVATAFGLAVAAVIFAIGHLSGAHINPAVTVAFALGRHFPWREVPHYVVAQLAGAVSGSAAILWIFGSGSGLGVTMPGGVSDWGAVAIEVGLTAFLVVVVLAVATDTRAAGTLAAIAVGATVGLEALVFGQVTGASMNPARSLGPAVVALDMGALWIYIVGPVVGSAIGVGIYELIRGGRPRPDGEAVPDVREFLAAGSSAKE